MTDHEKAKALREILNKHCCSLVIREMLKLTKKEQSKISEDSGKERNAISKNLYEAQEITLPTFLRYWQAIDTTEKDLNLIYTSEIKKTIELIILMKDLPNFKEFTLSEKDYFRNHSFQRLIRNKRKFLSKNQQAVADEINKILEEENINE